MLWPKKPIYFCKTSGTTSGTKFIPIKESMPNHITMLGRYSILCFRNKKHLDCKRQMIFLQGSPVLEKTGGILTGRLIRNYGSSMRASYLIKNRLPSFETNCIEDWELKVEEIVNETVDERMSLISEVSPWVQMYFEKLKKENRKKHQRYFSSF